MGRSSKELKKLFNKKLVDNIVVKQVDRHFLLKAKEFMSPEAYIILAKRVKQQGAPQLLICSQYDSLLLKDYFGSYIYVQVEEGRADGNISFDWLT